VSKQVQHDGAVYLYACPAAQQCVVLNFI